MKRKPLQVNLHVHEPSVVELKLGDRVQLDRLTPSPHGYVAERHGRLLDPGSTTIALEPGRYFFKSLSDANLRVVTGGVSAGVTAHTKDGNSPDPPKASDGTPLPSAMGDETPGDTPNLTLE